MTEQRRTALKELQKLDTQIVEARQSIQDFDPLFEEVEEPALILESELGTTRTRVQEMKLEEARLELSIEEKKDRQKRLDERLGSVRNLREEAAASAQLEMVKRALQTDEQEAFSLLDHIRKMDERLEQLEASFAEAQAVVEPKREELLQQRADAKAGLLALEEKRAGFVAAMDPREVKTYDAIRDGGRRAAVAELTADGACSNCFGMVPLQLQNELRHGDRLIRCEACGVILAAPDPEAAVAEEAALEALAKEAEEAKATEGEGGNGNGEAAEDVDEVVIEG